MHKDDFNRMMNRVNEPNEAQKAVSIMDDRPIEVINKNENQDQN